MAQRVVHLLEAVQVNEQQRQQRLLAPRAGQGRLEPVQKQLAVGQVRELVVLRHVLQAFVHLFAFDGSRHLGGDELQQLLVLVGVAALLGVALQHQRAQRPALRLQGYAQPVQGLVLATKGVCHGRIRRQQQGGTAADHLGIAGVVGQTHGRGCRQVFVDVVRKAEPVAQRVIQSHRKIGGRQQPAHDLVDVLEQRLQVVRGVRGFGDGVDHRLHRLCGLALRDVMGHGQPDLPVGQPACRPANVGNGAVLAHIAVFKLQLQLALGHALGLALRGGQVVGVHHVQHALANDFLGLVSKDAFERGTDKHDRAVHLNDADGVQQQVRQVQ